MHPSGGIRRSKSTSVTIRQQTATQGASCGGGGRSSYRTPGPPRKTACCLRHAWILIEARACGRPYAVTSACASPAATAHRRRPGPDGRGAAGAGCPGHAGQLAGPAVQPVGLPARARADPDSPHRARRDPAGAAACRARPGRGRLRVGGPHVDARRGARRDLHRRLSRAPAGRDPHRALPKRAHPVQDAPPDVGVQVDHRDGRWHPGRARRARPGRRGDGGASRARRHVMGGRDRAPPARHARRDAVQRGVQRPGGRRPCLRADLPVAAARRRRAAGRRVHVHGRPRERPPARRSRSTTAPS